ncbi:MAG TPA: PAS domain S-box protein [Chthoniobacterales bacterium]
MTDPGAEDVLILTADEVESGRLASLLEEANLRPRICADAAAIRAGIERGCGALILAAEVLGDGSRDSFEAVLLRQPDWADLSVVILADEVKADAVSSQPWKGLGNVTLLERPLRPASFVSVVRTALRARRRQIAARGLQEELQAGEDRLLAILGSISDAFAAIDREWRFSYVNPSYMQLVAPLYKSPDELLGQNVWEKFPDIVDSEIGQFYRRMMNSDSPGTFELFYEPLKAWLEVRASPSAGGLSLYVQNISERKVNEARVQELSQRLEDQARIFDTTLSNIADFAYTFDREGRFIYVNKPLLDLWGLTLEEGVGKTFFDLQYPDELATLLHRQIQEVFESGRTVRDETAYTSPAGETGFYEYIFSPVFDSEGQVEIVAGSTRVITERKQREAEVQALTREIEAQANLFQATLANIPDLVYSFDREARVLFANKALLEVWGKSLVDVLGKNVFDLEYPPALAEKIHRQLLSVFATGKAIRDETVFTDAAGRADIHDYIFSPVFDENGTVTAVVGTTRLLTEHRRAEGAMRQLAAIVQFSDDAIVSKDLSGVISSWNKGAQRLFGYSAEEAIGRPVLMLIPPELHHEETIIMGRISRGEPVEHFETERVRKDGSRVMVSLTISPIKDGGGKIVGASKIARDISEQKRIEAALKEAKDVAEAASRSKDRFLAVLSHELRTPLTPVLMVASSLEMDPTVPAGLRADMAMIRRNVELETKLIDDLLDLSRITMGKLALHLKAIPANDAVRQAAAMCEAEAADKDVRLVVELDPAAGQVQVDPARLQQVLWNVLKNAIKFTPKSGRISVRTSGAVAGCVQIAIQDSGVGIDPEVLPKIFDAFEQGDVGVTRQFGGLGLGLAISKALIELHEGEIRAESDGSGQGSTFTIDLPAGAAEKGEEGPKSAADRRDHSLRVLIVEDHADTAAMLTKLLGAMGYAVTAAHTAGEGLALVAKQEFDIVVSDLGLPDMTGYEFIEALKKRASVKSIAMSGYGMEEDIRKSFASGFDEHLVKPVDLSSLERAIRRLAQS